MAARSANNVALAVGGFAAGATAMLFGKRLLSLVKSDSSDPSKGRVPIFVMMPLDTISDDGKHVRDIGVRRKWLKGLKTSGVRGIMVDVWWGLCEPSPGKYNFDGYKELCELCKEVGLKVQAVMSFHQCGGNVGDSLTIPIPEWALKPAREGGFLYQDYAGNVSLDCLSLSADNEPIFPGKAEGSKRDALTIYGDFMQAFSFAFLHHMGDTIVEIQVGMGPCGELRYPSYMLSQGWDYPGVGLIMAYDAGMTKMLQDAATAAGKSDCGKVPDSCPQNTNGLPNDSQLFARNGSGASHRTGKHGSFFLEWYHRVLLEHGEAILRRACSSIPKRHRPNPGEQDVAFSVKVSGIHWHCMHPGRPAESCAGYVPSVETGTGAYSSVAKMLGKVAKETGRDIFFNFTCLEMSNASQGPGMPKAMSAPEDLIAEVRRACIQEEVPLCGENALQFDLASSKEALDQVATQTRGWASGFDKMHSVTLLRLDEGFARPASLKALRAWIASL